MLTTSMNRVIAKEMMETISTSETSINLYETTGASPQKTVIF
jgi:hypothetical protein